MEKKRRGRRNGRESQVCTQLEDGEPVLLSGPETNINATPPTAKAQVS